MAIYGNSFLFWALGARPLPVAISSAHGKAELFPEWEIERETAAERATQIVCARHSLLLHKTSLSLLKRTDTFTALRADDPGAGNQTQANPVVRKRPDHPSVPI